MHPILFSGLFQRHEEDFAHEYYFSELSHALNVLQGLNKQRLDCSLCDVTICVQGCEFPCHRNVLAACSPYFLAMFTGEIEDLKNMLPSCLFLCNVTCFLA